MSRILGCATVLAAELLLAACSSSTKPSPAATFSTHWGQDAATIASHIPGCTGVTALDAGYLLPGTTTAAACRIDGHRLIVYGWRDAAAQKPVSSLTDPILRYAQGVGWSAVTNDAATAAEQASIARRVVAALGGKIVSAR